MTTAEVLHGARMLLAKRWIPDFCAKRGRSGGYLLCDWNDPDVWAWDLEGAVHRTAGQDFAAAERAWGVLDDMLGAKRMDDGFGWGGAVARCWSREAGRTQAEVLALVARACSRATRMEVTT